MKDDLDALMEESDLDALVVFGPSSHNPNMTYFTGRVHLTRAFLVKKRGQEPIVFHTAMERDEAAASGLRTQDRDVYESHDLREEAGEDVILASALGLRRAFADHDVRGRLALYGIIEINTAIPILRRLEQIYPEIESVDEPAWRSVLGRARSTKDADEVERIRAMGKLTTAVVADVANFLTSHQVVNGVLVNRQGEVLTIGEVKRRINLWLAMRDAENPEGTIFAIGRDAGVPHSAGRDDQPVEAGKPIIFDLFPCEARGGYFYDFTRTWCLGYAPDEVLAVHQDVLEVYEAAYAALKLGTPNRDYQVLACERFEAKNHPTLLGSPGTQEGYVHSLGHGLGLEIHEAPSFRLDSDERTRLQKGIVFSLEPGLYYPERELGVRLEDTVWARPDGGFEVLADYPKDLLLKVPGV